MELRKAIIADLEECVKLLHTEEFQFTEGGYPDEYFISAYLGEGLYVYINERGYVDGVVLGENLKNGGFLLHCIVVKDKNKGIGFAFLKKLERELKINLEWIILMANPKALTFYKKNNYIIGKNLIECFKEL